MSEHSKSGDNINANISAGDISGQLAIGKEITQTHIVDETQINSEESDPATLLQMLATLKAQVEATAPPTKKEAALERLEELEEAMTAQKPDLSTMEYVKNWFAKKLPELAGSVTSIIVHPIIGKLVEAAGDTLVNEYHRRFGKE